MMRDRATATVITTTQRFDRTQQTVIGIVHSFAASFDALDAPGTFFFVARTFPEFLGCFPAGHGFLLLERLRALL